MQIDQYDAETAALIHTCLEQQQHLDPKILKTLALLKKKATKQNDAALLGFTYFYLANTYYMLELNYHNFRSYISKAIPYLQSANETPLLVRAYNFIGLDACNNGSYDVAYHYFMMALRVAETLTDTYHKSVVNANLGQLYARLGNVQLARQLIRVSIKDSLGHEEDIFYYHNLVSSYYLDGILSIRLNDFKAAKRAGKEIDRLELLPINNGFTGVEIIVCFLRAQLALIDEDREGFETQVNAAVDHLNSTHLIFDFMEDIDHFSLFLIERGELAPVRRILDKISNSVMNSGIIQMMKIVTDIEIAYYEAAGDEAQTNLYLRRQHELEIKRESEQNRVYLFSIGLVDSLDEIRKTQIRQLEDKEALRLEANADVVTGLPNRVAMNRLLEITFDRARAGEKTFGVALIDVDDFTAYNAQTSSAQGDACLQQIASVLRTFAAQPGLSCARYGGDRFAMIFENMKDKDVTKIAKQADKKINALAIAHNQPNGTSHITVSQGICNGIPKSNARLWDYLLEADDALRAVKKKKRSDKDAESFLLKHPQK